MERTTNLPKQHLPATTPEDLVSIRGAGNVILPNCHAQSHDCPPQTICIARVTAIFSGCMQNNSPCRKATSLRIQQIRGARAKQLTVPTGEIIANTADLRIMTLNMLPGNLPRCYLKCLEHALLGMRREVHQRMVAPSVARFQGRHHSGKMAELG